MAIEVQNVSVSVTFVPDNAATPNRDKLLRTVLEMALAHDFESTMEIIVDMVGDARLTDVMTFAYSSIRDMEARRLAQKAVNDFLD